MAKFFRAADGAYGLRQGFGSEGPIPDGAEVVEFDAATNAELIDSLCGLNGFRWQDHSIENGQIIRAGVPVAINPPRVPTDVEELSRAVVALALLSLDELNGLRQWIAGFKIAVAAATSLADLKTRVAALPNTPDRTRRQLLDAVRARLAEVDS